jgi:hypothetical protein
MIITNETGSISLLKDITYFAEFPSLQFVEHGGEIDRTVRIGTTLKQEERLHFFSGIT